MSAPTLLADLLAGFGPTIGLPDLAPDESGYCALVFDEKLVVNLEEDTANSLALLYGVVGELGGDAVATQALLLEANYLGQGTDGGTLGLKPDEDVVVLSRILPLTGLDLPTFSTTLERFVNTLDTWTQRLAVLDSMAAEEPVDEPPYVAGSGMIRG